MFSSILLQVSTDVTVNSGGFLDNLLKQGPVVGLLALAVWWLVKLDQKQNDKLEKYIAEDRKEMLTTIQNNTSAMNDMSRVMEDKKEVDNELLVVIRQLISNNNHKT